MFMISGVTASTDKPSLASSACTGHGNMYELVINSLLVPLCELGSCVTSFLPYPRGGGCVRPGSCSWLMSLDHTPPPDQQQL